MRVDSLLSAIPFNPFYWPALRVERTSKSEKPVLSMHLTPVQRELLRLSAQRPSIVVAGFTLDHDTLLSYFSGRRKPEDPALANALDVPMPRQPGRLMDVYA